MSQPTRTASWGERTAGYLLRFMPKAVGLSPERTLINLACILMGVSSLVNHHQSQSLLSTWPDWLVLEWSLGIIAGGALTLISYLRCPDGTQWRSVGRVGILLIILCCAFYGLDLLVTLGLRGMPTALIFLAIAVAKIARLIVSSATQGRVLKKAAADEEVQRAADEEVQRHGGK